MKLSGEFLLVGPSSLTLKEGHLEVLGATLGPGEQLVVPAGRQAPMVVDGDVEVKGPGGSLRPAEVSYVKVLEETYEILRGSARALIVGPSDVGKSTLAAYLYNRGLYDALVTTDVGQNELYCPGFEAAARPRRPFIPGMPTSAVSSCFVGGFSPSASLSAYETCLADTVRGLGSYVVDTDGWVDEEALAIKSRVAASVGVDRVVSMGLPEELLRPFKEMGLDVITVRPTAARSKSRAERRLHRDRLIASCLSGSRVVRVSPNADIVLVGRVSEPRRGQLAAVSDGLRDHFAVVTKYDSVTHSMVLLSSYQGPVERVKVGPVRIDLEAFRGLLG